MSCVKTRQVLFDREGKESASKRMLFFGQSIVLNRGYWIVPVYMKADQACCVFIKYVLQTA